MEKVKPKDMAIGKLYWHLFHITSGPKKLYGPYVFIRKYLKIDQMGVRWIFYDYIAEDGCIMVKGLDENEETWRNHKPNYEILKCEN